MKRKHMKTNSLRSIVKVLVSACSLFLLPLAACPRFVEAQTNTFPASGNAGIGTTSPQNPLTIARSGSAPWTGRPAYELLQLVDRTNNTPQILLGSAFNGMFLRYTGTDGTATNQRLGIFTGGLVEAFMVNNNGNVGVGTTSPLYSLDVNGGVNGFRAKAASTSSSDTIATFENASGIQAIVRANGNVGIGTTAPSSLLHLRSASHTYLQVGAPLGFQSSISFNDDTNGQDIVLYRPENSRDFSVWTATSSRVLTVTQSGNVGVGTTSPASKLDVTGNLNASGTITGGNIVAKYQDIAEWVQSSQVLQAATVVVLDRTKSNQVIASSQAYDTRVAGVISSQPGITLGEKGERKVLVATSGRVKVKVDATAAPIQVGDLLVTGDKEGVAKKSEPLSLGGVQIHRPGTLIGKALEPLEKGTGEILVLLSLQ
jgi:hypothetical protein